MAEMKTAKYVRTGVTMPSQHEKVEQPIIALNSDENYGNLGFSVFWECIPAPFEMVSEHHNHDFPQYLCFLGGDGKDMLDLGGEVELTLSEDGKNLEKHVITKATTVYIPAGLYHCPLNFKRVDKPIIFMNIFFAKEYSRNS